MNTNMTHVPKSIAKQPIDPNGDVSKMANIKIELAKKVFSKIKCEKLPDDPKCDHEYRVFGTRIDEEVYEPVRGSDGKPKGYYGGWVICDKCGDSPHVAQYEVTHKRPYNCPVIKSLPAYDLMVKIIKWKNID